MKLLKIGPSVNALTLALEHNQAIALLLGQPTENLIGQKVEVNHEGLFSQFHSGAIQDCFGSLIGEHLPGLPTAVDVQEPLVLRRSALGRSQISQQLYTG